MREAMGGAWLLGVVLVFIILFSGFLAISINYSRAFSVKNEIISYIERNEGFTTSSNSTYNCTDKSTQCQIQKYLKETSYWISDNKSITCPKAFGTGSNTQYAKAGGYCVKKVCTRNVNGGNSTYYTVATFVRIELPVIWSAFNVPITGQTMSIVYDVSSLSCS